jgi:hypothetical protein
MTDISQIKSLLDWKLLRGSHPFPGPDGGTCINEVAIVAAGLPYRPVEGPRDLPPTFSRELGTLLLCLNDALPDDYRQRLKGFVLRLPGSKDDARTERERCEFLRDSFALMFDDQASKAALMPLGQAMQRQAFAARLGKAIGRRLVRPGAEAFLDAALAIIEASFAIGRGADRIEAPVVEERLAAARRLEAV